MENPNREWLMELLAQFWNERCPTSQKEANAFYKWCVEHGHLTQGQADYFRIIQAKLYDTMGEMRPEVRDGEVVGYTLRFDRPPGERN